MMNLFGKTRFTKLTVYNTVKDVVKKNPYKSICQFYFDKVVVGEYVNNDTNVLRIWKNNATIGIDKSYTGGDRMIGALDYSVLNRKFKIEFLYVLDSDSGSFNADPKYSNANEYVRLMISVAEAKARELGLETITMDTHRSLRLFNRYYKNEGFIFTGRVAGDNRYWLEMTKKI